MRCIFINCIDPIAAVGNKFTVTSGSAGKCDIAAVVSGDIGIAGNGDSSVENHISVNVFCAGSEKIYVILISSCKDLLGLTAGVFHSSCIADITA